MHRPLYALIALASFGILSSAFAIPPISEAPPKPSEAATKLDAAVERFLLQTRRAAADIEADKDLTKALADATAAAKAADDAFEQVNKVATTNEARVKTLWESLTEPDPKDPKDASKRTPKAPPQRKDFKSNDSYIAAKEKFEAETAELTKLKASAQAELDAVNAAQAKLDLANAAVKKAKAQDAAGTKIAKEMADVKKQLDQMKIGDLVEDLKIEGLDTKAKLGAVVARLDTALLGRYMMEKLERVIGSKEFCDATKACATKPEGTPVKLDTMFDGKTHSK